MLIILFNVLARDACNTCDYESVKITNTMCLIVFITDLGVKINSFINSLMRHGYYMKICYLVSLFLAYHRYSLAFANT